MSEPLELPESFTRKGNLHWQVVNEKPYYIYIVSKEGVVLGYEVFLSKISKEWVAGGNVIPSKYAYPSDESFGKTAFFCVGEKRAFEKLEEIKRHRAKLDQRSLDNRE